MTESPAIRVAGLTRRFGARLAVDDLTFAVSRGSIFGFLGPNGAGKTTTIRMLLGLTRADHGDAWLLGHHFVRDRRSICARVGAIVETPTFHKELTGIDNLRVLAWTSGVQPGTAAIQALLDRVGLAERGSEPVGGYSLGMRQRLGLAAALVHGPELLFLDEPTNGLDPAGTLEVRRLLRELSAGGTTIFLSSHILHEVQAVCDEVAILHRGRLRLQGRVDALVQSQDRFLLRVQPVDQARTLAQQQGLTVETTAPDTLAVTVPEADLPTLVSALATAGIRIFRVEEAGGNLEALFIQWTQEAEGE